MCATGPGARIVFAAVLGGDCNSRFRRLQSFFVITAFSSRKRIRIFSQSVLIIFGNNLRS
jgi:hypothetical protein